MNVLFLTHRLPYAPNRGDRVRAYYLLREMARVATVSVFSLLHDDDEASRVGQVPFAHDVAGVRVTRLRNLIRGGARISSSRPLTHALLDAPDARDALTQLARATPPDVVVAYCSGMARFALEPPLDTLPFVLDMVDVDSAKWAELAVRARRPAPVDLQPRGGHAAEVRGNRSRTGGGHAGRQRARASGAARDRAGGADRRRPERRGGRDAFRSPDPPTDAPTGDLLRRDGLLPQRSKACGGSRSASGRRSAPPGRTRGFVVVGSNVRRARSESFLTATRRSRSLARCRQFSPTCGKPLWRWRRCSWPGASRTRSSKPWPPASRSS